MTDPFTTLGDFLAEDNWYPVKLESRAAYRATFTGKNGKTTYYFRIREDLELFMAYVLAPVNVPEEMRNGRFPSPHLIKFHMRKLINRTWRIRHMPTLRNSCQSR